MPRIPENDRASGPVPEPTTPAALLRVAASACALFLLPLLILLLVVAPLNTAEAQDQTPSASASAPTSQTSDLRPIVRPEPGDFSADLKPADRLGPREPDLRLEADRNAFNDPPAGYDSRRFQIEPVPLADRRIRDLFEIEPYEHLGWRLGNFILYSQIEISGGWDSNVFYEPSARADWLAAINSETRLVSDWDNHALELRMRHAGDFHRDFPGQDDAARIYELRGRLDVRRSTKIEATIGRDTTREEANAIDAAPNAGSRRDVTTDRATVSANHSFNRLSLDLRGAFRNTTYDDPAMTPSRDFEQRTITGRASWSFRPTLAAFGELGYDHRDRAAAPASDGLSRSSDGERVRVGLSLGQTGAILRGEASIGYGRQRPDSTALPDVHAFLIDANLAWRITPLTALLFTAETTIDETSVAGASAAVNRRLGVGIRHAFRRHLIGEAGLTYGVQDYRGGALDETSIEFRSRVEYAVNRHVALFSEARHTRFDSTAVNRDYDATSVRFGARLRN